MLSRHGMPALQLLWHGANTNIFYQPHPGDVVGVDMCSYSNIFLPPWRGERGGRICGIVIYDGCRISLLASDVFC